MKQLICTAPEVRAILDNTQTLLLREIKWPHPLAGTATPHSREEFDWMCASLLSRAAMFSLYCENCPFGVEGETRYLAEEWLWFNCTCLDCQDCRNCLRSKRDRKILYRADGEPEPDDERGAFYSEWHAPITMNQWKSRMSLRIANVDLMQLFDFEELESLHRHWRKTHVGPRANVWLWALKVEKEDAT